MRLTQTQQHWRWRGTTGDVWKNKLAKKAIFQPDQATCWAHVQFMAVKDKGTSALGSGPTCCPEAWALAPELSNCSCKRGLCARAGVYSFIK